MHEQVEKILAETSVENLTLIARGVLGDDSATLAGDTTFTELTAHHNDARTIGIIRASGTAVSVRHGSHHNWSSVVKVIDMNGEAVGPAHWISTESLENEPRIYEHGLMSNPSVPFRAAECYFSQEYDNGVKALWLEDLTTAPQPPWSLDQFIRTANHVGQFNGYYSQNEIDPSIHVIENSYLIRWQTDEQKSSVESFTSSPNTDFINRAFGDVPINSAARFEQLFQQLLLESATSPANLSFGDCHARNMFPLGGETVAIDWANLTFDPIGVDIGVLAGSALSWGQEEALLAISHEKDLFESYMAGMLSSGWSGNERDVRKGFFCQFGGYLSMLPPYLLNDFSNEAVRRTVENRLGIDIDSFPEYMAPIIALLPTYIEEIESLLD